MTLRNKEDNLKKEIQKLVDKYKKEIEVLKQNDGFKDSNKIQTVCVLREVCQDLELLMDIK